MTPTPVVRVLLAEHEIDMLLLSLDELAGKSDAFRRIVLKDRLQGAKAELRTKGSKKQ